MNEQLKPCPFCGNEAACYYENDYDEFTGECIMDGYVVHCGGDICPIDPQTPICDTEAEAIAAWNRRAAEPNEALTRWIPVTERLPGADDANERGIILAYSNELDATTVCTWHRILGDDVTTHWMPFPKPPKGE